MCMYGWSASAKPDDHFSNLLDETQDDIQTEAYNPLFALTKGLPTKRKLRHSHSMPKSCS